DYLGGSQSSQGQIVRITNLNALTYTLSGALPAGTYRAWVRALKVEGAVTYTSYWSPISQFSLV
ncbi:MAG: hypothetical protein KDA85_12910, partial [Planctomycetaceae bacterium]|nr:hypothetical protein [Planctomycetaceae bacterium]